MNVIFYQYKNQKIDGFNEFVKEQFKLLYINYRWINEILDENASEVSKSFFESQSGDVLILPVSKLIYPIPEPFEAIALLNSRTHFKNKRTTDNENYVVLARKSISDLITAYDDYDLRNNYGTVYITGFGPGDPDLLTVKAIKVIEKADVIFYDSLINHEFLEQYDKEKIFVGKRKGNHSHFQEAIDELLYQSAISGKNTVRLKGGDPFIYGRGGEEFDYLRKRFVNVEVIPGITAAFGAAAYEGISLTQRGISSSVAFCTGYPKENRRIPDADTLVFYMSASNLQETAQLLIKNDRKPDTAVALIRNATRGNHESQYSRLEEIANGIVKLASPMVAIIGDVAINKNYERLNKIVGQIREEWQ